MSNQLPASWTCHKDYMRVHPESPSAQCGLEAPSLLLYHPSLDKVVNPVLGRGLFHCIFLCSLRWDICYSYLCDSRNILFFFRHELNQLVASVSDENWFHVSSACRDQPISDLSSVPLVSAPGILTRPAPSMANLLWKQEVGSLWKQK